MIYVMLSMIRHAYDSQQLWCLIIAIAFRVNDPARIRFRTRQMLPEKGGFATSCVESDTRHKIDRPCKGAGFFT